MNINKVKELLASVNTDAKKQFGQNFLMDENIIRKICNESYIDEDTYVLEIGPGLGFLTEEIAKRAKKVLCYEIDSTMIEILNQKFKESPNVVIKHQDFLKANINQDLEKEAMNGKVIVVANLPYYITTAILIKILEETNKISALTVMMQQEVAYRICGTPSTKEYNALSVLIQYYTDAEIIIRVGADCFYPKPNVDSSVVRIVYKDAPAEKAMDEAYFKKFNRAIFSQRRKTLVNNLKVALGYDKEFTEAALKENNLDIQVRSEALSVEEIVKLANTFYKNLHTNK